MTQALTEAIEAATETVQAVEDPVERFRMARELRTRIGDADRTLLEVQKAAIWALHETLTWAAVGEKLGFSGSRAEAIARGR